MINRIKFSLVLTSILAISAFVPILNIFIMMINGGILYPFSSMNWDAHIWINLILTITLLALFYRSKKQTSSILLGLFTVLFAQPFFLYSLESMFNGEELYFLQFLISGLLTGGLLIIVEYLKK